MKNKGITLIALTVTVIVLLIISGVTISYLTGENGIINQAKDSKKFAGAVEEKEVLNTSVAAAIGKSSNSKIDEVNLKKYLNQNVGDEVKDYTLEKKDGYYSVTFTATGNEYVVWENGTVQDMDEYQKTPYLKLDPSELNALETESSQVIKAITNVDNPNISWETNNSNIVTIQKKSNTEITVTGKNNGSAVITAKMDKLETKCQVTVLTSPKEIILSNTEITIDLSSGNKTVQITPTITPDSANKNITWTSSNTSIARVDEFGTITGISNGEATVTAKTVNGLTKICKVKVVTSPTAISLNKTNAVIDTTTSKNMQLTAVITPASANIYTGITWTSSNDNVVQVNQQGLVKGISNGLATVTAKTENGCTAQCRIVVGATIAGINLAPSNSAIEIEEKLQINATIEPNTSEETLIWVSSNSKVATVDQNGLVTGKSHGTVTITATGRDSMVANSVKVTVQTAPKSVALNIINKTIDLSSNERIFQLVGTISPSTANVYTHLKYTSSDKTVADVDENTGRVTALKNGTATITVSTENNKTATCNVTVVTSPTGVTLDKSKATVDLSGTKTVELTAKIQPDTANIYTELSWISEAPEIAQVEKLNGSTVKVTGISNGSAKIKVRTENGKEATCVIVVETSITGIEIIPKTAKINMLEDPKLQLNKKLTPESATELVTWTSSNTSVATVDKNGLVTGVKAGVVTITVKNPSGDKFDTATITVTQKPTESTPVENVKFSTEYGRIDVIWLDNNNNVISNPNAPILTSNGESLTPIKWNGSSEQTTNSGDGSWYNYNSNMWANAKTKNGSYFVWIPRFAYRIRYYSDSNCTKLTGYFDGLGQWSKDGKLRRKLDSGIQTVNYNDESYIVHPAFETNLENGGWSNELSGFWVAKFQASPTSYREVKFVPGENSSNIDRSIGQQYYYARTAKYGYNGTKDSDGYTSFMYSHMMKNSEWGAVAYLTQSIYGRNGIEICLNNYYTAESSPWRTAITGMCIDGTSGSKSTTLGNAYNTTVGVKGSSTANITGIYDLNGCIWEYMPSYISNGISNLSIYGSSYANTTTNANGYQTLSTKWATVYPYNSSSDSYTNNYSVYSGKKSTTYGFGDAVLETSTTDSGSPSWNGDCSDFPGPSSPFFGRGGCYGDTSLTGLFAFDDTIGGPYYDAGFRSVLVIK